MHCFHYSSSCLTPSSRSLYRPPAHSLHRSSACIRHCFIPTVSPSSPATYYTSHGPFVWVLYNPPLLYPFSLLFITLTRPPPLQRHAPHASIAFSACVSVLQSTSPTVSHRIPRLLRLFLPVWVTPQKALMFHRKSPSSVLHHLVFGLFPSFQTLQASTLRLTPDKIRKNDLLSAYGQYIHTLTPTQDPSSTCFLHPSTTSAPPVLYMSRRQCNDQFKQVVCMHGGSLNYTNVVCSPRLLPPACRGVI